MKLESDLEFIAERLVVEEDPWILVLSVPMILELSHALDDSVQLGVTHQANERCARLWRHMTVGCYRIDQSRVG